MSSHGKASADASEPIERDESIGANAGETDSKSTVEIRASHQEQKSATEEPVVKPESAAVDSSDDEGAPDGTSELERRIAELEEENSALKDQFLRKSADFENLRKRMQREVAEAAKYGNSQIMLDLVTIIDDFERAIKSADESKDFDSFYDGIAMIEKQFTNMLDRKWGLRRLESVGEEFDPQVHEAIMTEQSSDQDHPVVVEDYQKGYMLHDRVLRSAKVKVAMPTS